MIHEYICPFCQESNLVDENSWVSKLHESIPQILLEEGAVSAVKKHSREHLPYLNGILFALHTYQFLNGHLITCANCREPFLVVFHKSFKI